MQFSRRMAGFSLVELSIVLVILGLLVGGVLGGQSLIEAAKYRSQIAQFNEFTLGTNAFKIKYENLPGDLANPATYGLTATASVGNGDGVVTTSSGTSYSYLYCSGEPILFWKHLSEAGLIAGNYTHTGIGTAPYPAVGSGFPKSKIDGAGIMIAASGEFYGQTGNKHYFFTGVGDSPNGNCGGSWYGGTPFLKPEQVSTIDSKLDDGMPLSGMVQARYFLNYPLANSNYQDADGSATSCITTTSAATARYTLSSSANACVMRLKAEF